MWCGPELSSPANSWERLSWDKRLRPVQSQEQRPSPTMVWVELAREEYGVNMVRSYQDGSIMVNLSGAFKKGYTVYQLNSDGTRGGQVTDYLLKADATTREVQMKGPDYSKCLGSIHAPHLVNFNQDGTMDIFVFKKGQE